MRDTFLLTINWASSLTVLPFIQEEIPASITNKSFALPRLARRFRPWFQLGQVLFATNSTLSAVLRLIGQKVCLDRTHVPLTLIQPEREGVLAVEFFPDGPVAPFRPPIALL
ncbi:hypothetical protein, partial [Slackia isoflavoniconvertens]|uniref:hypothetical protein n=1 Tax=Slackia isoflavoniconvertens TaxID=572010 RepID=UPI003AB008A9